MEVLEKAYRGGYKKVEGLAVCGPLQPDEVSGLVSPTLHPCNECRRLIRNHPLIFPDTLILTADDSGESHEVYNMLDFFRLHGQSYFDDRDRPYHEDLVLAYRLASGWNAEDPSEAIAGGWEPRKTSFYKRLAGLALQKAKALKS